MALTAEQSVDLAELRQFRTQLRAVVYGGATSISVAGVTTQFSPDAARQSLADVENRIAAYTGGTPSRPTYMRVRFDGGYEESDQSDTEE